MKSSLTTVAIVLSFNVIAQPSNEIRVRLTPNIISAPKVVNSSAAIIYGQPRISFEAAAEYAHFINFNWGIRAGLEIGTVDWNYFFKAPRNAFGNKQGSGTIEDNLNIENYQYNALSLSLLRRLTWKNMLFTAYGGYSMRYYRMETDPIVLAAGYNRIPPYDPNAPTSGQADLLIDIPKAGEKLHLNISTGIDIERKVTERSYLTFGIRKNWGLSPIGKGNLLIQMYDKLYPGEFSPRSNYWGIDLGFNYKFSKPQKMQIKPSKLNDAVALRKAFFLEYGGNGIGLSANFDMRFQRDRNDGFGFRAGLGMGSLYLAPSGESRYVTLPLGINYLLGKGKSSLETGIGITPQLAPFATVADDSPAMIDGILNVGYRFQPTRDDLMFRITWSPTFSRSYFDASSAGVSLGYSFGTIRKQSVKKSAKTLDTLFSKNKFRKSIYVEALGAGYGLAGLYDMRLKRGVNKGFGVYLGAGITSSDVTIPAGINYLAGSKRSALETGIGYTQLIKRDSFDAMRTNKGIVIGTLGYRYQPINDGLLFRVNWTPNITDSKLDVALIGLSIGYSFK